MEHRWEPGSLGAWESSCLAREFEFEVKVPSQGEAGEARHWVGYARISEARREPAAGAPHTVAEKWLTISNPNPNPNFKPLFLFSSYCLFNWKSRGLAGTPRPTGMRSRRLSRAADDRLLTSSVQKSRLRVSAAKRPPPPPRLKSPNCSNSLPVQPFRIARSNSCALQIAVQTAARLNMPPAGRFSNRAFWEG
jgi:hypothetical protein